SRTWGREREAIDEPPRRRGSARPAVARGLRSAHRPRVQDHHAMDQSAETIGFGDPERRNLEALLPMAMAEDLDQVGDITTTATSPSQAGGVGLRVARSPGVLAGMPVAERLAAEFEMLGDWRALKADGDRLEPGTVVARLAGPMRSLLTLERTAL